MIQRRKYNYTIAIGRQHGNLIWGLASLSPTSTATTVRIYSHHSIYFFIRTRVWYNSCIVLDCSKNIFHQWSIPQPDKTRQKRNKYKTAINRVSFCSSDIFVLCYCRLHVSSSAASIPRYHKPNSTEGCPTPPLVYGIASATASWPFASKRLITTNSVSVITQACRAPCWHM